MRIPVPKDLEAEVLFKADHICSICHNSNLGVQVAHIDDNNSNNIESNLMVVCLHHHDKMHSKSYLSKSYTEKELLKYKEDWETIIKKRRKELQDFQAVRLIRFDGKDINTIYLETEPNVLRGFQDSLTFELLGFNWGNVDVYPDSYKSKFVFQQPLKKLSDCRRIRLKFTNGSPAHEIFVVWEDGRKHHVPDPDTMNEIGGFTNISDVDFMEFNSTPHGQPLLNIFFIRTNRILREAIEKSLSQKNIKK